MANNSSLVHCISPTGLCSVTISNKSIKQVKTSFMVFAFNLDEEHLQQRLLQFIEIVYTAGLMMSILVFLKN